MIPDARDSTIAKRTDGLPGHLYRTYVRTGVKLRVGAPGRGQSSSFFFWRRQSAVLSEFVMALDRVRERRRAAALARHYRDAEGLSIREISRRLGRAEATVKAYLNDPTGEKARAVKGRYQGVCRGCGAPTAARGGKGDAYEFCKRCHPGAIAPTRTRDWVRDAMHEWRQRYGRPPSSTDWSRTHARRRGGEALERFLARDWPAPSTVIDIYGSWSAAHADAFPDS